MRLAERDKSMNAVSCIVARPSSEHRLSMNRMNLQYILYMRERQASTSVGASTARKMGPAGTVDAAREFLKSIDLHRFKKRSALEFRKELDLTTEELRRALPQKARYWGSARKFLNIFLRGCCYNKYLCGHYGLGRIEPWLEVPLDKYTALALKRKAGRGKLPPWSGVIRLTPPVSELFQRFAAEAARGERVNRVDLDIKYWRRDDG